MSAPNLESAPEPTCATVPGFPELSVMARSRAAVLVLYYYGWPADLIAAGIVPKRMLTLNGSQKRDRRVDGDGTRWHVLGYWRLNAKGRRARYFKVSCHKPIGLAMRLPGAKEAVQAQEQYQAWRTARYPQSSPAAPAEDYEKHFNQSAADWKSSVRGFCEDLAAPIVAVMRGSRTFGRRFRLDEESIVRIQARTSQYFADLLREIDRAPVVDSQQPQHGARLRVVVDNTRGLP